jgi:hypothetical protein
MTDLVGLDLDFENLENRAKKSDQNQNQIKPDYFKQNSLISLSSEEICLCPETNIPEVGFDSSMENQPLLQDHSDITYNQFPGK